MAARPSRMPPPPRRHAAASFRLSTGRKPDRSCHFLPFIIPQTVISGKPLPTFSAENDFLRRKRPVRFGAHHVRLDDRLPGNRSAAGGRFSLRPRPRDRSGIEKIRDALDKLRLAARNRKMVPAAERDQFFLQIIAAKRLCVQRRAQFRSFAHGYNSSK